MQVGPLHEMFPMRHQMFPGLASCPHQVFRKLINQHFFESAALMTRACWGTRSAHDSLIYSQWQRARMDTHARTGSLEQTNAHKQRITAQPIRSSGHGLHNKSEISMMRKLICPKSLIKLLYCQYLYVADYPWLSQDEKVLRTQLMCGGLWRPGRVLRGCADQLAYILTYLFYTSLDQAKDPTCFWTANVIPVLKKP